jgi:hypothetical protein
MDGDFDIFNKFDFYYTLLKNRDMNFFDNFSYLLYLYQFLNNSLNYLRHFHYLLYYAWNHNNFLHNFLNFNNLWHFNQFLNNFLYYYLHFLHPLDHFRHLHYAINDHFHWPVHVDVLEDWFLNFH